MPQNLPPFSSFLTQGMNNTNKNINNMGNRNKGQNQFTNPYQQSNSFGNSFSNFGGTSLGYGDINNPPIEDQPGLAPMGAGFDVNNDGVVDVQDALEYQSQSSSGQGGFEDFQDWGMDFAQGYGYNPNMQIDNPETTSFNEFIQNYVSNYDFNIGGQGPVPPQVNMSQENIQQWLQGLSESDMAGLQDEWNTEYGQAYDENPYLTQQNPMSWQDYMGQSDDFQSEQNYAGQSLQDIFNQQNPNFLASTEQGFLDNLMNYINPQQSAAQEFKGGGGQAGQQARKLYYPGTSGGFAGTGSGIGGGGGIQSMLKNLMG